MTMLKNKKNILLALFMLTVIAGIYYPISKIIYFEHMPSLVCRFKVELVDPYDAFRGRYVALSPVRQTVRISEENDFKHWGNIYAVLERGKDGFARVVDLSNKLVHGKINLRVEYVDRVQGEADVSEYIVNFPFTRYYMNEYLAPKAEEVFLNALRSNGRCAVVVKVYENGNFAIDDLEIDGIQIREFIRVERKTQEEDIRAEAEEKQQEITISPAP